MWCFSSKCLWSIDFVMEAVKSPSSRSLRFTLERRTYFADFYPRCVWWVSGLYFAFIIATFICSFIAEERSPWDRAVMGLRSAHICCRITAECSVHRYDRRWVISPYLAFIPAERWRLGRVRFHWGIEWEGIFGSWVKAVAPLSLLCALYITHALLTQIVLIKLKCILRNEDILSWRGIVLWGRESLRQRWNRHSRWNPIQSFPVAVLFL